jgi:hypothetical protein
MKIRVKFRIPSVLTTRYFSDWPKTRLQKRSSRRNMAGKGGGAFQLVFQINLGNFYSRLMAIGPVGVWEPTKYTNLLSSNINE